MKKMLAIAISSALISACGNDSSNSGGGGTDPIPPVTLTGVFEDSRVIGLNYRTDSSSGVTNELGEFKYQEGEMVAFSLGELELGSALGASNLNTFDIGDSFERDVTTGTYTDINIATLLQSLDSGFNPASGFIDLTGMINNTTGISLENGVTKELLDAIVVDESIAEEITVKDETSVLRHATRTYYKAIAEMNQQLILDVKLQQEDVDTGHYRVGSSMGIFADDELLSTNGSVSIESDLTVTGHNDLERGVVRNRIGLFSTMNKYAMGLGIRYISNDDKYYINYFLEEYNVITNEYIQSIQPQEVSPSLFSMPLNKDQAYTVKIEYDAVNEVINGYIDGSKLIFWELETAEPFTQAKIFVDSRASAFRDSSTGLATSAGAQLTATVDNLVIITTHPDGSVSDMLSDNFDDNLYDNPAGIFSYSNRYRQ